MTRKKNEGTESDIVYIIKMFDKFVSKSGLSESTVSQNVFGDAFIRKRLNERKITVAKLIKIRGILEKAFTP